MPFIAYFFVLVLSAATAAVSLDYLTAPGTPTAKHDSAKVAAANPPGSNAIRQVPLGKPSRETTAQAFNEDNDKTLTPVYPAAPGKNLPAPDAAEANAVGNKTADAKPADQPANDNTKPTATTTQQANASPNNPAAANSTSANESAKPATFSAEATPVSAQASVPAPGGACAIEACASAYRSFRASDCTYQPYGGPRKMCDLSADGARQASNMPSTADSLRGSGTMRGSNVNVSRARDDDLDDVVRTVRRLPGPQADYDDDDDGYDRGRVVVIRRDGARPYYGPRYIYEAR